MSCSAFPTAPPGHYAPRALALLAWATLVWAGCRPQPADLFHGYLEGEYVYASAPVPGTVTNLAVQRGTHVRAGQLLFQLEPNPEFATRAEAAQRLEQARARLANLRKGRRPSELAALEAQLERARANLQLAEAELSRRVALREQRVIAAEELDSARTRRDADQAQVRAFEAELETARLGGRADEVAAAEAEVAAFAAALEKAEWNLKQKTQVAPVEALVHDTLFDLGEWVPAGMPVVALLPQHQIKARFFVPEPVLSRIQPGGLVTVTMDGSTNRLRATVRYISPQAEFTPPVIYSRQNRSKLVYMVEAAFAPQDTGGLRPGQPVDVRIEGAP